MDQAAFSSPAMSLQFEAFATWLEHVKGPQTASISVHRYLPFFVEVEGHWGAFPDYGSLIGAFGAERLRRARLPMRWLSETGQIVPDATVRKRDSEQKRIDALLATFSPDSRQHAILSGYHAKLMGKLDAGKTNLHSIRLALSPAVTLLSAGSKHERTPPTQHDLDALLRESPGQRAALSGFVNYLRSTCAADVVLPKENPTEAAKRRRRKLEAEMLAMIRQAENGIVPQNRWLSVSLAYFHGLPRTVGRGVKEEDVKVAADGGFDVAWEEKTYWVPGPLAPDGHS